MNETELLPCKKTYLTAPGSPYKHMNVRVILEDVSRRSGTPIETLQSKDRHRDIVDVRSVYYYRARRFTKASLNKIGSMIGRDHATVLHGLNAIMNVRPVIDLYRTLYGEIPQKINT